MKYHLLVVIFIICTVLALAKTKTRDSLIVFCKWTECMVDATGGLTCQDFEKKMNSADQLEMHHHLMKVAADGGITKYACGPNEVRKK